MPSCRSIGLSAAAAVWLVLLSSPVPLLAQRTGVVDGRVTTAAGQPLTLAVHLLGEDNAPVGTAYSDSNGNFAFTDLPNGTYYVVVEAKGFKPFREGIFLDMLVQPRARVSVMLEPAMKVVTSPSGSDTQTLNARCPLPPATSKAAKELDKGNKARDHADVEAAIQHYEKAIQLEPRFYPALNNRGVLLDRQGRQAEAEQAFLQAVEICADDGEAYLNLGHMLYKKAQYPAAIARLEQGLSKSPQSPLGNFLLGSAYLKQQNLEKAEPLLKKAYELDPEHMSRARLQLANLYLKTRNYDAARTQLQEYLRANPSDPQTPAIKKTLADLDAQKEAPR